MQVAITRNVTRCMSLTVIKVKAGIFYIHCFERWSFLIFCSWQMLISQINPHKDLVGCFPTSTVFSISTPHFLISAALWNQAYTISLHTSLACFFFQTYDSEFRSLGRFVTAGYVWREVPLVCIRLKTLSGNSA